MSRTPSARTWGVRDEMTFSRADESGEHEWKIELMVCAHYEPAENGGRDSPSYDAYICDIEAFYWRSGKGWSVMELSEDEEYSAQIHLMEHESGGSNDYDGDDDDGPPDNYYADRAEAAYTHRILDRDY